MPPCLSLGLSPTNIVKTQMSGLPTILQRLMQWSIPWLMQWSRSLPPREELCLAKKRYQVRVQYFPPKEVQYVSQKEVKHFGQKEVPYFGKKRGTTFWPKRGTFWPKEGTTFWSKRGTVLYPYSSTRPFRTGGSYLQLAENSLQPL